MEYGERPDEPVPEDRPATPPPPPGEFRWSSAETFPVHPHGRPEPPPQAHAGPSGEPDAGVGGGPVAQRPPAFSWGWRHVLWGTLMVVGLQLLIALPTLLGTDSGDGPKASDGLAVFTLVFSLLLYGYDTFSAWLFSLRYGRQSWSAWGLRRVGKAVFWIVPTAFVSVFIVSVVNQALVKPPDQQIIEVFPHSALGVVCFGLTVCVAAPFFEEIFFRGFMYRGLASSWGPVVAAIVSAALFAAAHLQLTIFLPLFALGLALAWAYQRTGSLWANIALHATWNGVFFLVWAFAG